MPLRRIKGTPFIRSLEFVFELKFAYSIFAMVYLFHRNSEETSRKKKKKKKRRKRKEEEK